MPLVGNKVREFFLAIGKDPTGIYLAQRCDANRDGALAITNKQTNLGVPVEVDMWEFSRRSLRGLQPSGYLGDTAEVDTWALSRREELRA